MSPSLPFAPSSALPLPPTPRDFDIHRAHVIEHISTRSLADKHDLSQTRIRQIVYRVNAFLAAALPTRSELEREQEVQLAQHLAAGQLQLQIEQLQIFWNSSSDPKYLRQQTRAILALARLGIVPGILDALAANVVPSLGEGHDAAETITCEATSAEESIAGSQHTPCSASTPPSLSPSAPEATLQFAMNNSQSAIVAPPPPRDCSPPEPHSTQEPTALENASGATPYSQTDSESPIASELEDQQGLALLEQRLLTLLAELPLADSEKRVSLEQTLRKLREEQATLQIRVSPDHPGADIQHPAQQTSYSSPLTPVS